MYEGNRDSSIARTPRVKASNASRLVSLLLHGELFLQEYLQVTEHELDHVKVGIVRRGKEHLYFVMHGKLYHDRGLVHRSVV